MREPTRTIGVSSGGGDCPGLNAVIRAVVRTARLEYGWRVIGVTNGRSICQVVVAEGVKQPERDALRKPFPKPRPGQVANSIGYSIRGYTNKEVGVTVLGHLQRGGSPSPFDRILATRFGVAAADLVARGQYDRMVCLQAGKIEDVPLTDAIGATKLVDPKSDYVRAARALGITFGDHP